MRVVAEGHEPRALAVGKGDEVTPAALHPGSDEQSVGVVVAYGSLADSPCVEALLRQVDPLLGVAPVAVLVGSPQDPDRPVAALEAELRARGQAVVFAGLTRDRAGGAERTTPLAVVGGTYRPDPDLRAPPGYRVAAFVTAFNEEDIVEASLERLIDEGVEVHFLDNWSTDRTFELAQRYVGRGVASLERIPAEGPAGQASLYAWLEHIERRSRELGVDWSIKHDVDEIRLSPWPDVALRDALFRVAESGFEAVDFTVVNFHPVDDGHQSGASFEDHFRHFDFGPYNGSLKQVKAWRATTRPLHLASTGGHRALPPDARVFPFNFLLKHYRFRSQAHAQRKLRERMERFRDETVERRWHGHYARLAAAQRFVRPREDLTRFDPATFFARYLTERLAAIPRRAPAPAAPPAPEASPRSPV